MSDDTITAMLRKAAEDRSFVSLLTMHGKIGGECRGLDPKGMFVTVADPGSPERGLPVLWNVRVLEIAAVGVTDEKALEKESQRIEATRARMSESVARAGMLRELCEGAAAQLGIAPEDVTFRLQPDGTVQAMLPPEYGGRPLAISQPPVEGQ